MAEKRSKLGGPPVEQVGFYDPSTKKLSAKKDRVLHWLGVGAKATASVHNLLVNDGILSGPKLRIKIKKGGAKAAETASAPTTTAAETAAK